MKTYQTLIKTSISTVLAVWMAVSFFVVAGDDLSGSMSAADFFITKGLALASLAAAVRCSRWAWRNGLTLDFGMEDDTL